MKQRPWRTLRCVVEVKVPPSNRSDEKDLIYHVDEALDRYWSGRVPMPRAIHPQPARFDAKPKVKSYVRFVQAETIKAGRPGPKSVFEQLVIRALYAIVSFTATRGGRNAISLWVTDAKAFLTEE